MTSDTSEQGRKSSDAQAVSGLIRTLQSMSRRFPQARLIHTAGAFGVQLRDGSYLYITRSGQLTDADVRDFLVLFARWLVVDPDGLRALQPTLGGASASVRAPEPQ
jgi:hypothetical protein